MLVRIAVAVVCVPLLLLAMLPSPPLVWTIVVALIAAVASFELLRAAGEEKISPWMTGIAVLSALCIPMGGWLGKGTTVVSICTFVVMAVSFWCAIRAYDEGSTPIRFYHVMLTLFSGVLIPLGLSALVLLKKMDHGEFWVLFAVLMAFVTDAGAYFVGVFFGKHRGVTRVSPNKSLEGYVGGFAFGVLYAVLYGLAIQTFFQFQVNFLPLVLSGLAGALATELGDLSFSFVKREFGIKDYGHLLPGHGGMLDRFDSMIFCAPMVLFILRAIPVM